MCACATRSCLLAIALAAVIAGPVASAEAETVRIRTVEERVRERLQHRRDEAGLPRFLEDDALDAVVRARAELLAGLPDDLRLAQPWTYRDELEEAGIVRWRRAYTRMAVLRGGKLVDRILAQWQALPDAWSHVLDGKVRTAGLATAYGRDGSIVFVAVLLEELGALPDAAELESAVVARINEIRVEQELSPLTADRALAAVARRHSSAMARQGFFDHVDLTGKGPGDRMHELGLRFRRVAENLGFNHRVRDPVDNAVRNWMDSPGHRANIVDARFRKTGVGVVVTREGKVWFTQLFVEPYGSGRVSIDGSGER